MTIIWMFIVTLFHKISFFLTMYLYKAICFLITYLYKISIPFMAGIFIEVWIAKREKIKIKYFTKFITLSVAAAQFDEKVSKQIEENTWLFYIKDTRHYYYSNDMFSDMMNEITQDISNEQDETSQYISNEKSKLNNSFYTFSAEKLIYRLLIACKQPDNFLFLYGKQFGPLSQPVQIEQDEIKYFNEEFTILYEDKEQSIKKYTEIALKKREVKKWLKNTNWHKKIERSNSENIKEKI